ncbi:unnamed protein product, partial [marine sediment metagenome]
NGDADGHTPWMIRNFDSLVASGFLAKEDRYDLRGVAMEPTSKLNRQGWIRVSGNAFITGKEPTPEQMGKVEEMLGSVPPEMSLIFVWVGQGEWNVSAGDVVSKGLDKVLMDLVNNPDDTEPPLGRHPEKKADAGGGTSGPFQQGDGQDQQHSFMENVQDGSTAPIERSY